MPAASTTAAEQRPSTSPRRQCRRSAGERVAQAELLRLRRATTAQCISAAASGPEQRAAEHERDRRPELAGDSTAQHATAESAALSSTSRHDCWYMSRSAPLSAAARRSSLDPAEATPATK